jgi:hypothetical protein
MASIHVDRADRAESVKYHEINDLKETMQEPRIETKIESTWDSGVGLNAWWTKLPPRTREVEKCTELVLQTTPAAFSKVAFDALCGYVPPGMYGTLTSMNESSQQRGNCQSTLELGCVHNASVTASGPLEPNCQQSEQRSSIFRAGTCWNKEICRNGSFWSPWLSPWIFSSEREILTRGYCGCILNVHRPTSWDNYRGWLMFRSSAQP